MTNFKPNIRPTQKLPEYMDCLFGWISMPTARIFVREGKSWNLGVRKISQEIPNGGIWVAFVESEDRKSHLVKCFFMNSQPCF